MTPAGAAHASRAMVAAPHGLATRAGLEAMRRGGGAVDAIVSAAAVLAVVYPHMCSIGGDAFALLFDPSRDGLAGLNGSGRSPAAASIETIRARGCAEIPTRGALPVTVPGVVDAWHQLARRYGRLPFATLLEAAIRYARDGFPVSARLAKAFILHAGEHPHATFGRVFFADGPPRAGATLRLPALARTLSRIAADPDSFYRGNLAAELVVALREGGGLMSREDLAAHESDWVAPITATYRDLTVAQLPPNSGGVVPLLILRLMERLELGRLALDDPRRIDGMARATRLAFDVARPLVTDPDATSALIGELLADEHVEGLAARLRLTAATRDRAHVRGDTVYLCAVDETGLACSFIQSVYFPFGSGFVDERTGVLFQNRGAYFSLDPAHANALGPRKRTYHTLMPAFALRDGQPYLVFGTMGADGQPQTQVQVLSAIVDHDLDPQAAIDAPRWLAGRSFVGEAEDTLALEARFPAHVDERLRAFGHLVQRVEPWSELMGHAQAIRISADGLEGGADPRGDGLALGY